MARRRLADRLLDSVQREVAFSLMRVAGAAGRDPRQDVRDLVHDVLVSLFEHEGRELRRWDPARGRSLDSFARLVARRHVARTLGQKRGNPWALPPMDPEDIDDDDDTALVRRLEERKRLDELLVALHSHMNERDHQLFDLLYVQQSSPAEVAQQLDMTRGAVNAWSYRIRRLARQLSDTTLARQPSKPRAPNNRGATDGR